MKGFLVSKTMKFFTLAGFVVFLLLAACENPFMKQILDPKTVSFNSNGGSLVPSQKLYKNEPVKRPADPVKTDFLFEGWFSDDNSFLNEWNFNVAPTEDMTLYAKWKPKRAVTAIIIKAPPDNLTYTHGETLNLTGLEVTLFYDDDTEEDVLHGGFTSKYVTANPAHGDVLSHLEHDGQPVVLSYYGNVMAWTDSLTVTPKVILFDVDEIPSQFYTGSALTPAVIVRDSDTAAILTLNSDYTVGYSNNTSLGQANVTITGIGNYYGSNGSAVFEIRNIIVTFNADGGTPEPVQQSISYGGTVSQPGTMTKIGHTFGGWYRETSFNTLWNFINDTVTEDITLYAKWNINQYTVTFNANGATSVPPQQTINHGGTVNEPNAITKKGYVLVGWYKESTFTNLWNFETDTVTENIDLYAKWVTPEDLPAASRWSYTLYDTDATVEHFSVDNDGVCKVTIGGTIDSDAWKVRVEYAYTATPAAYHEFKFMAWTEPCEERYLNVQYYSDDDDKIYREDHILLTSTPTEYSVVGLILKDGVPLRFQCADELGTFYIQMNASEDTYVPWKIFYAKVAEFVYAEDNLTITVSENLTLPRIVYVPSNNGENKKTLTIKSGPGGPYTLKRDFDEGNQYNGLFHLWGNAKLIFEDIEIDGDKTNRSGNVGPLVKVNSGAEFTLGNNAVLKNNRANQGGGVFVDGGGTFNMNGTAEISGNDANTGGGVYVSGGTFNMSGTAEISGNEADNDGGGVYVAGNSIFTVGGAAKVRNNLYTGSTINNNVNLTSGGYITLGTGITSQMEIWVQTGAVDGVIVNSGANQSHVQYFHADDDEKSVALQSGNKLALVNYPIEITFDFTLPEGAPELEELVKIYRSNNSVSRPATVSLTAQDPTQYDSIEWYYNGILLSNAATLTLDATDSRYNMIGPKFLTVEVVLKGSGVPYSRTIRFEVVQ